MAGESKLEAQGRGCNARHSSSNRFPTIMLSYSEFAQQLVATNIISDPWLYGAERFRLEPVVLDSDLFGRICQMAQAVGRMHDELAQIIWNEPQFLDSYFHLTPFQRGMWLASGGRWHGIARVDCFVLQDGRVTFCEMNSDTPSGEAETVLINQLLHPSHHELQNPNAEFEERFVEMVLASGASVAVAGGGKPTIGILYPTDLPEDLSMIALYQEWFQRRGHRVVLGSPYNLHRLADGSITMFDVPIHTMIRHYKTDWWGERLPIWLDEPEFTDPDPLASQLIPLLEADAEGSIAVVNPFGSVLTQNKLAMAFFYDHIERFTPATQRAIVEYLPETRRLDDMPLGMPRRNDWVLKSDYGCEGDEVVLGPHVSDAVWEQSLRQSVPARWIAQRYFQPELIDGAVPNYGVYLIAGQPAGIFTRLSKQATDYTALVPPTFVR